MYVSCSGLACVKARYPRLRDTAEKIAQLGFGAFDVDALENWQHCNPSALLDPGGGWRGELMVALEETGLRVSSFNCGLSAQLTDPDPEAFARYKRELVALLEVAEEAGCPNITLQPGSIPERREPGEVLSRMRGRLAEMADLRGDSPVTVSLEGHANTPVEDPEVLADVVAGVWPLIGLTYDPSHFELQGIPLPDTEYLMEFMHHVHVRNASLGKMQDAMAAGTVDFEWLVAALERRGYAGGLAIEYFSDFDPGFETVLALRDRLVGLGVADGPA